MENTTKRTSNLSVLYIESNISLQKEISSHLNKIFNKVYQSYDGESALIEYKKSKPDIIITDLDLSKKNSFEMIVEIQELCSDVSIIVLSYKNSDFELLETLDLGIIALLEKPLNLSNLNRALQKVILLKPNKIETNQIKKIDIVKSKQIKLINQNTITHKPVMPVINEPIKKKAIIQDIITDKTDAIISTEVKSLSCATILSNTIKKNITCINNYKGLVITNQGHLLTSKENTFSIQVTKTQLVSALNERQIVINVEQHYIHAKLIDIDKKNNILTFANAQLIQYTQRDNTNKRLVVDKSFKASIDFNHTHIELIPIEVSYKYIALETNKPLNIHLNATVDLTIGFEINGPSSLINEKKFTKAFATGVITRIQNYNNKQKIVIEHIIQKSGQNVYKKYLQQREINIINEFKMKMKS